jgi:hypothetical protein
MQDEPMVRVQLELVRDLFLQRQLDCQNVLSGGQIGPVADAKNVRVYRDRLFAEGHVQHDVGGLSSGAGQRF